jgi:hypothetical protein
MPLSAEQQALYDHGKAALPRFLFVSESAAYEWLYQSTMIMDRVREYVDEMLASTFLEEADTRALNLHAKERGTTRRVDETNAALVERLRTPEDALTEDALLLRIRAIVVAAGVSSPQAALVNLRRDRAHAHATIPNEAITVSTGTFSCEDENNPPAVVTVTGGTYTAAALHAMIDPQLPADWVLNVKRGRLEFLYPLSVFSIAWNSLTLRNELGFTADAVDWNPPQPYTGNQVWRPIMRLFASRGYRVTNANRPQGYVVILPYGTSSATRLSVEEYLRLYGPGGYVFYTEVRANP